MKFPLVSAAFLLAAGVLVGAAMHLRPGDRAGDADVMAPALPARTSRPAPAIPEPPRLPPGADAVPPLRFRVTTAWQRNGAAATRATQQVTRTAQRIRVVLDGTRHEWHFERNPLDPRRLSAYLVDHGARQLLAHEESELRSTHQLRGWADALSMRVDGAGLARLRRTGERRTVNGVGFLRHGRRDGAPDALVADNLVADNLVADNLVEVWWSDQLLLPLSMTVRRKDATIVSEIDGLEFLPATTVLEDPRRLFPSYAVLDVADVHEHRR
jgi:hypothetical protein